MNPAPGSALPKRHSTKGVEHFGKVMTPPNGVARNEPFETSGPEINLHPFQKPIKTVVDFVGGYFLLLLLSPLFILIAFLIKLDSPGPVFFRQKRVSRNNRRFPMFKFRTMKKHSGLHKKKLGNDHDGPIFKKKDDPRITEIGKYLRRWSLDELPQLINVIRGDMSLVGPRPLARKEMKKNALWRTTRLMVKPGMTGYWQVMGRGSGKFSDWVKYDISYVTEWSPVLELKILLLTFRAVIWGRGE